MKSTKTLIIVFTSFLLILMVVIVATTRARNRVMIKTPNASGKNMSYKLFKKNTEAISLTCSQSKQETKDRLLMSDLKATIFKNDKQNKDLFVEAKTGIVENNLYDFILRQKVRLTADKILMTGDEFFLKSRIILTSLLPVEFQIETFKGTAQKGIKASLSNNYIFFYDAQGSYLNLKNKQEYLINAQKMVLADESKSIQFWDKCQIKGDKIQINADIIYIIFTDDYKYVRESFAKKNAHVKMKKIDEKGNEMLIEAKGQVIKSFFRDNSIWIKTVVNSRGEISIINNKENINLSANTMEIYGDKAGKNISHIEILRPMIFTYQGKEKITFRGNKTSINFNSSEHIQNCHIRNKARLSWQNYNAAADKIYMDNDLNQIEIKGKNSQIIFNKNQFYSGQFNINSKDRTIVSTKTTKTIFVKKGKTGLFRKDPIYIYSMGLFINDKENLIRFEKDVSLQQYDMWLKAGQLLILKGDEFIAREKVKFQFIDNKSKIDISADQLNFDLKQQKINITGTAKIIKMDNKIEANKIVIKMSEKNEITEIKAYKVNEFSGKNIIAKSDQLIWEIEKDQVSFSGSAQINHQQTGKTTGQKLLLNLKNNKITVVASDNQRAETILK